MADVSILNINNTNYNIRDDVAREAISNGIPATKLKIARKIGNASFDGSADITLAQMGAASISHDHSGDSLRATNYRAGDVDADHTVYGDYSLEYTPGVNGDPFVVQVNDYSYGSNGKKELYSICYNFFTRGLEYDTTYPVVPNIGTSSTPWNTIYLSSAPVISSDRSRKQDICPIKEETAMQLIMGLEPSSYKMIDGISGRTHYGLIAQDVESLLEELHIDNREFAGLIKSPRTQNVTRQDSTQAKGKEISEEYDYSLRYEEFIAPLIKVVQIQQREIETLKEMVNSLKQADKTDVQE